MKLPRSTIILLLLALGLGGFVYFHEIRGASERADVQDKKQQIFSFTADDVLSLTIQTKNSTLNLQRNPQSDRPKWVIKSPISEPANDAIVSYLLDLLVKGKSTQTIPTPPNQMTQFGLDQPQATITINLKTQQTHQLILGKTDFSKRFLYAQVDPATKNQVNINVLLVSTDFSNAVNRELSEWKQSLPSTPSPTPSPTSTSTPSPTPTSTPSPTPAKNN